MSLGLLSVGADALAKPPSGRGGGPAQVATDVPNGYRVVNATAHGQALAMDKPGIRDVSTALKACLSDAAGVFGSRPNVLSAYEDQRDHLSGMAKIVANGQGRNYRGLVLARLTSTGAKVLLVYADAKAPRDEWKRLIGHANPGAGPGSTPAAPEGAPSGAGAAHVRLSAHQFSDGTGFIALAPGWRTDLRSCANGLVAEGPGNQRITLGIPLRVVMPGYNTAGSPFPVAPFMTPAQALQQLAPQLSRISQGRGGPGWALDHIEPRHDLPKVVPMGPNAAVFSYGITESSRGGGQTHFQAVATVTTLAIQGNWTLYSHEVRAPDATFQHDLPLMLEMAQSWRIAPKQVAAVNNKAFKQYMQQVEQQQAITKARAEASYQRTRDWEQAQKGRYGGASGGGQGRAASNQASNDDVDEYIRGYRTIEDTRTGERHSVDLGNVDEIVDGLNRVEADRFRQIPLRDDQ
jgi:hypothetical protein